MTTTTSGRSMNGNSAQPQRLDQPATTDMVSPAVERKDIHVGFTGAWIDVPMHAKAVVVLRGGHIRILGGGRRFINPQYPGNCQVYLIDVGRQMTPVQATALSADNWDVGLDVEVWWHIADPVRIIRARRPARSIQVAGREALRDLIQSLPHDRLVGCGMRALDSRGITDAIKQRLTGIPGIQIERVNLVRRTGDAWRIDSLRRANVEATRCQQALAIETNQNALQQARLAQHAGVEAARYQMELAVETSQNDFRQARNIQRVGLLDSEQEVSLKEARITWQREQEFMHGRVEKAKLVAEEGRHIQKKEFLDIQSNNLRNVQEREYALKMEAMKQQGKVLSDAAQALTAMAASQGVLSNMDAAVISWMAGMEALSKELAYTPQYEHILGCEGKNPAADGLPGSNGRGVKGNGNYTRPIAN